MPTDTPDTPRLKLTLDPLKYIERIQPYDGNPEGLKGFIDSVDLIIPTMEQYDAAAHSIFYSLLKTKILGKALTILEINSNIETWTELKIVLNNNFADRRNLYQLIDDLRSCYCKTTILDFFNEIQDRLRKLNIKTGNEYRNQPPVLANTIKSNMHLALDTFKNKLPEPVRAVIFARNPNTLEEAINYISEAGYLHFQNKNQSNSSFSQNQRSIPKTSNFQRPFNQSNQVRQPNRFFRPNSGNFRNFANTNSQPSNSGNFRNFPNTNSQPSRSGNFRNNPEPMDISNNQAVFQLRASETKDCPNLDYLI